MKEHICAEQIGFAWDVARKFLFSGGPICFRIAYLPEIVDTIVSVSSVASTDGAWNYHCSDDEDKKRNWNRDTQSLSSEPYT